jgi:aminopeptidase N
MKEVFANFMAAKIVNPSFPDIDHELRFLLAHYPAAYAVDRTAGANPIRQPLENLDEAGSPLRRHHLPEGAHRHAAARALTGEAPFREALRRYLAAHRFGNAGWPTWWPSSTRVTELDVPAWSRVWIEEPGRPTIAVAERRRRRPPARRIRAGRGPGLAPGTSGTRILDRRRGSTGPWF